MFSSVDLPHPDGPTTQTNSPGRISSVRLSTAVVSWRDDTNRFETPRSDSSGADVMSGARATVARLERMATISVGLHLGKVVLLQHLVEQVEREELAEI